VTGGDSKRVAVLIDGDNFPGELADRLFADIAALGNSIIRRVYGSSGAMTNWREPARRHGIALREGLPGKNAADMHMAIEAMDILHRGRIEAFCIVSSDSDFTALARRLREDGVAVHGFGDSKAVAAFRQACDNFVVLNVSTPTKNAGELASVTPQPKTPDVARLLGQAIIGASAGATEAPLTAVGQHLRQLKKDFSVKQYGAKNLKTLLLEAGLELKKTGNTWIVVLPIVPRREAA
jgi:hypothetical protein